MSGDTLFWAASTAKGVATTVAHVLVERGELDYDGHTDITPALPVAQDTSPG